ncbi:MAG: HAD family phosphatase [Solobacterium sp.]|nr:HAD family phosphatase [Solobacterium sp.]
MSFLAVIFDVDGVLVDSEYIFLSSIRHFLAANGLSASFAELSAFLGRPEAEITRIVRETYHLAERFSLEEVRHGIYDEYAEVMESGRVPAMPQLKEFLAFLKERGVLSAVATSGTMQHYEQIRRGISLAHDFDVIVTYEEGLRGKPAPDIFLKTAEQLAEKGVRKEEMAVIEDSPNGIKAAKAAGLFVFGYKGSKIHQDTSGADLEIRDFQEIINYMEGKGRK